MTSGYQYAFYEDDLRKTAKDSRMKNCRDCIWDFYCFTYRHRKQDNKIPFEFKFTAYFRI